MPPRGAFGSKFQDPPGPPFYRRYGSDLPSSLTRISPLALVFSTWPPVSVCGTGDVRPRAEVFLVSMGLSNIGPFGPHHRASACCRVDLPALRPTRLNTDDHRRARLPFCTAPALERGRLLRGPEGGGRAEAFPLPSELRHRLPRPFVGQTPVGEYRLLFPFDYACRPRLRSRLTRGRRALPRNP